MTTRPLSSFLARLIWLCIAPLLLLAFWLAWVNLREEEARHLQEGANLAQNQAIAHDNFLTARIGALAMLAGSPLAEDPRRWSDLYAEALGFQRSFGTHVIFADSAQQMLFNTRTPFGTLLPKLPRPDGRSATLLALESGQPQVGDLFFGPVAKQPLVAIVLPHMREGKVAHLMATTIETAQLQQRLDKVALPEDWSLALVDGTGADIARRAPVGFDASRDVAEDHRFVVALEKSAWSVVVEIPRGSHQAAQWRSLAILGGAILLATLFGILGGSLASRRIGRELTALAMVEKTGTLSGISEFAAARTLVDKANAAERAAEERFHHLLHVAPLPPALVADDGRILMLNTQFHSLFGYAHEDLPGVETWFLRAYADAGMRAQARSNWTRSTGGEDVGPRECRITCKDGGQRDILISLIPQPEGTLAFFIDLTAKNQSALAREAALAELNAARLAALNQMEDAVAARRDTEGTAAALQESQQRLRLLIDHAPAALAMFDGELRYLAVSQRWRDDYALGGREFLGQSHYEIFPEIGDAWKAIHRRGLAGETISADEDRFERADGTVQWLRWEVRPWCAADGTVGGIVIFSENITARMRANAALRLSEQKFATTFAQNPAAVALTRLDDGRYVEVNDTWTSMTGFSREEAIGHTSTELGVWPSPQERDRFVEAFSATGTLRPQEFELVRKSGERFTVEVSSQVLEMEDGRLALSTLIDVTARKQAEAGLRTALAAQERATGRAEPDGGCPGRTCTGRSRCRIAAQAVAGRRAESGMHRHHRPRCQDRICKPGFRRHHRLRPRRGHRAQSARSAFRQDAA